MLALIPLAYAFASPWSGAAELRLGVLVNVWVSELDDFIDRQARSWAQVDDLVSRCLACVAIARRRRIV